MEEKDFKNIEAPSKNKELTLSQKRWNTGIFTMLSCLFILLGGIFLIGIMIYLAIKLFSMVPGLATVDSRFVIYPVIILGLVLILRLNKLLCGLIIKALNLQDKLEGDFVARYVKK